MKEGECHLGHTSLLSCKPHRGHVHQILDSTNFEDATQLHDSKSPYGQSAKDTVAQKKAWLQRCCPHPRTESGSLFYEADSAALIAGDSTISASTNFGLKPSRRTHTKQLASPKDQRLFRRKKSRELAS